MDQVAQSGSHPRETLRDPCEAVDLHVFGPIVRDPRPVISAKVLKVLKVRNPSCDGRELPGHVLPRERGGALPPLYLLI